MFVALTGNSDLDLQGQVDAAVASGGVVLLHAVRADALASDRSVAWGVHVGEAQGAPPAFDGSDTFDVAAVDRSIEPVLGWAREGAFETAVDGAGQMTIELAVSAGQPPIAFDLIAARVAAELDGETCSGRLGGAITQADVDGKLLPSVVAMMNAAIERVPGCPDACEAGTSAALIVEVFDTDANGTITLGELKDSAIIRSLGARTLARDPAARRAYRPDRACRRRALAGVDAVSRSGTPDRIHRRGRRRRSARRPPRRRRRDARFSTARSDARRDRRSPGRRACSQDWDSPDIVVLDEPLSLAAGEGITFRCTFRNDGDEWVVFGTGDYGEMCAIMTSYAYPKHRPNELPPSLGTIIYRDGHSAPLVETTDIDGPF